MKSPSKSCELDPIPTDLLKDIIKELAVILRSNKHITTLGYFSKGTQRRSFLWPLLKKATQDFMIKRNFRTVSNLAFPGKLIEHIVANQIISHIDQHNLMKEKQSAYRRFHSTENCTPQC